MEGGSTSLPKPNERRGQQSLPRAKICTLRGANLYREVPESGRRFVGNSGLGERAMPRAKRLYPASPDDSGRRNGVGVGSAEQTVRAKSARKAPSGIEPEQCTCVRPVPQELPLPFTREPWIMSAAHTISCNPEKSTGRRDETRVPGDLAQNLEGHTATVGIRATCSYLSPHHAPSGRSELRAQLWPRAEEAPTQGRYEASCCGA